MVLVTRHSVGRTLRPDLGRRIRCRASERARVQWVVVVCCEGSAGSTHPRDRCDRREVGSRRVRYHHSQSPHHTSEEFFALQICKFKCKTEIETKERFEFRARQCYRYVGSAYPTLSTKRVLDKITCQPGVRYARRRCGHADPSLARASGVYRNGSRQPSTGNDTKPVWRDPGSFWFVFFPPTDTGETPSIYS